MGRYSRVIAVIPARGGSKRIPRKNLLPYRGKPLIAHSIEDARLSDRVDRVLVSTDDPEIKDVAQEYGAEVIDRPAELAGDRATSESALLHVLDTLESREGYRPDVVVFLQCTSPERDPRDIDNAVALLEREDADSVFSACRFDKYIWHSPDDSAVPINYDYRRRWRDQDFPPQFMENGSLYVCRADLLRETHNRLGGKIVIYEMEPERSFQIDHLEDLGQATE